MELHGPAEAEENLVSSFMRDACSPASSRLRLTCMDAPGLPSCQFAGARWSRRAAPSHAPASLPGSIPEVVAIEMPAPLKTAVLVAADPAQPAEPLIQTGRRPGPLHLKVRWPTSAPDDFSAGLRELLSGMFE